MKRQKIQLSLNIKNCLSLFLIGSLFLFASCNKVNHRLISVSDIHFNPYQDSITVAQLVKSPADSWEDIFAQMQNKNLPKYNEECNPILFDLLLKSISKKKDGISAVLFTGDILCHDFNDQYTKYTGSVDVKDRNAFIYKTMSYVSMKMRKELGQLPIYFTLGNNDSYRGDYTLLDDGEFLKNTSDLFYDNFINPRNDYNEDSQFKETYSRHGYYTVHNPIVTKGRIIGLNTNFFSMNNSDSISATSPAAVELNWLEEQFKTAEANAEKLWILLHIPPGVNVYSTEHRSKTKELQVYLQWKAPYNQRYLSLIKRYHKNITASFAGHTHMDDFRLIYDKTSGSKKALNFIHITPSVSPVFGNNPVFQILTVDNEAGTLNESVTYHVDLSAAQADFNNEYSYKTVYGFSPDLDGLNHIYPNLLSNTEWRKNYISFYPSGSKVTGIRNDWKWYWTGIGNLTTEDYKVAYKDLPKTNK